MGLLAACGGGGGGPGAGGAGGPGGGDGNVGNNGLVAEMVALQVVPTAASRPTGLPQQYTAFAVYSDGTRRDVTGTATWASTTAAATIAAGGLASTVAPGTSSITARLGAFQSNAASLTVTAAVLASLQVSPATASRPKGTTQQFTAQGTYTDGTTADLTATVTWASGSTAVAGIAATGVATAVDPGTSAISASFSGIASNAATLTVTPAALASIAVSPAQSFRSVGLRQQFRATGTYTDGSTADITGSVAWHSDNPAAASIDAAGLATSVAPGAPFITAVSGAITSNRATMDTYAAPMWQVPVHVQLTQARGYHTATLLRDGRVLVAGGEDLNGSRLAGTEPLLPRGFSAPLTHARSGHQAVLMTDGSVLVVGGTGPGSGRSDHYDPATDRWNSVFFGGSREGASVVVLPNGTVLVTGGYGGGSWQGTSMAWIPRDNMWGTTIDNFNNVSVMWHRRGHHTATQLPDGRILVAGGENDTGALAEAELYNPRTNSWTQVPPMAEKRALHSAALLPDGRVLVAGGEPAYTIPATTTATSEIFDPATMTWSPGPTMVLARSRASTVPLPDGRVLIIGGSVHGTTTEVYDPVTNTLARAGELSAPRTGQQATLLPDGRVLVTGGWALGPTVISVSDLFFP